MPELWTAATTTTAAAAATLLSSSMMRSNDHHRMLFDSDYLDANCDSTLVEFDDDLNVDNLPWTYITNYFIWATAWVFAFLLWKQVYPTSAEVELSTSSLVKIHASRSAVAMYFALIGSAFGIAGIGHQVVSSKKDTAYSFFEPATAILIILSTSKLLYIALGIITNQQKLKQDAIVTSSATFITILLILIFSNSVFSVLYNGAVMIGLACIYAYQARYLNSQASLPMQHSEGGANTDDDVEQDYASSSVDTTLLTSSTSTALRCKCLGIFLIILAGLIQLGLSSTCGAGGYENCFEDCPLPTDPFVFNHNAWFHVIYNVGLLILGIAECKVPSVTMEVILFDLRSKATIGMK